jgi:hypothetical protein
VSLVGRGSVALALEHMAKMAAAVRADDLGAGHAVAPVLVPRHGARNTVEIGRPAAAGLELVVGLVQRRVAACTGVDAFRRGVLVIFAGEWCLCTLFSQNTELLCQMC